MTVVIVGGDRVGTRLARTLIEEKADVIIFEKDTEKANEAANSLDCMVINKDGTNLEDLKSAGISKAEYFISLTGSDERNMIACGLVNREFNIPNKIARVHNINFSHTSLLEKSFLGIDYIVNPELEAAKAIISKIEHGATGDIILFKESIFQIRNLTVTKGNIFENKFVKDMHLIIRYRILIALIMREEEYIIPKGDTQIKEGDILYLMGTEETLSSIMEKSGKPKIELKKVVIVGGKDIGSYVCEHFYNNSEPAKCGKNKFMDLFSKIIHKKNITIVDRDYAICKTLAAKFPEALILNADISDEYVFEDEGLVNNDIIITTTNNQELNIVTSVYAKSLGIKKSLALVNKTSYLRVASNLGIDVPVSINYSMIQGILNFIKRKTIQTSYMIPESDIEAIQLQVSASSRSINMKIKNLNLPAHSLLLAVKTGGKEIIPNGDYEIKENDNIILLVRKNYIEKIQKMFTEKK